MTNLHSFFTVRSRHQGLRAPFYELVMFHAHLLQSKPVERKSRDWLAVRPPRWQNMARRRQANSFRRAPALSQCRTGRLVFSAIVTTLKVLMTLNWQRTL